LPGQCRSSGVLLNRHLTWYRELGLGTPYVWLAGPISGLVAQPLIGAISDSSTSKYRRRYWIVAATILLVFSGLALAFTEPIAAVIVDLFGGGQGDWDPKRARYVSYPLRVVRRSGHKLIFQVQNTAIGIAVFAFYCLDFALNG
jgi:solute carrier family 45 protein 1/2/4